jgi:hypothetical protein
MTKYERLYTADEVDGMIARDKAAPVQPVAMTFDEAWASLSWQEWRMKSPKELFTELHRLTTPQAQPAVQEPIKLDHIACIDDGVLRYMTGRKAPNYDCELYAMPDGKNAPRLYTTAPTPLPPSTMAALVEENQRLHAKVDQLTLAYKQALEQLHFLTLQKEGKA